MNIAIASRTGPSSSTRGRRRSASRLSRETRKLIARVRRNPDDEKALEQLREHYTNQGDQASLANLMEAWAQRSTDPIRAAERFQAAADAVLASHGNKARAAYLLERCLQRRPHGAQQLDRLTALLAQLGEHEALKHALQRVLLRLKKEPDAEPKWMAAVEYRLGNLYQSHYGADDKALQHYRLALQSDPSYLPAIHGAQYLYRRMGDQRAVALLWELEVQATPQVQSQVELLLGLSTHQDRRLGDLNGAISSLRRALRMEPGQLLTKVRLARLLLARYRERGEAADRARAAAVYLKLAAQTRGDRAAAYARQCLELDPDNSAALARLRTAAQEGEDAELESAGEFAHMPSYVGHMHWPPTRPAEADGRSATADTNADPTASYSLRRDVEAWLHHDELSPLARDTAPLEPVIPAQEMPPPTGHICRVCETLPTDLGRETLEVNLGATTSSHLYVTLDGHLRAGGVFAATYRRLALNTKVALILTLPGGFEAKVLGRVRFARDSWDCVDGQEPGMAIEFEALAARDLEWLEQFAAERPPMLYDA